MKNRSTTVKVAKLKSNRIDNTIVATIAVLLTINLFISLKILFS